MRPCIKFNGKESIPKTALTDKEPSSRPETELSSKRVSASDFYAQFGGMFLFMKYFMYQYPKQILFSQ